MPLRVFPTVEPLQQTIVESTLEKLSLPGPLYLPEAEVTLKLSETPIKKLVLPETATVINLEATIATVAIEAIGIPSKPGRYVQLVNNTANTIILQNKKSAEAQISIWGGTLGEYPLKAETSIWLYYDKILKRWINPPTPPIVKVPIAGANGTITVGLPGIAKENIAVIVGDGVTLEWKVKHGLVNKQLSASFAEGATGETPIASPFQEENFKVAEAIFKTEAAKVLAAGRAIWIKLFSP